MSVPVSVPVPFLAAASSLAKKERCDVIADDTAIVGPPAVTMSGADNDSESSLPTFRPFTREELAVIEKKIADKRAAAKKRAERRARNIAVSSPNWV